ncbi:hypothetical protein [Asaia astilbis]|uniref:hypothetical protein n=1 Tax=Asaia astilbis TaxID=610244 RepID=UPI00046F56F4|nr:hypothetical protein [Asaia astilbis]
MAILIVLLGDAVHTIATGKDGREKTVVPTRPRTRRTDVRACTLRMLGAGTRLREGGVLIHLLQRSVTKTIVYMQDVAVFDYGMAIMHGRFIACFVKKS